MHGPQRPHCVRPTSTLMLCNQANAAFKQSSAKGHLVACGVLSESLARPVLLTARLQGQAGWWDTLLPEADSAESPAADHPVPLDPPHVSVTDPGQNADVHVPAVGTAKPACSPTSGLKTPTAFMRATFPVDAPLLRRRPSCMPT